jgi:hypothetical protein
MNEYDDWLEQVRGMSGSFSLSAPVPRTTRFRPAANGRRLPVRIEIALKTVD